MFSPEIIIYFFFRIEYTSTENKRVRLSKDIHITAKTNEQQTIKNQEKKNEQKSETDTRDTNGNYYICIGLNE